MKKKRKLKKWVYYLFTFILSILFMFLLGKLGLIKIIDNNTIDILNIVLIFSIYEIIKHLIKKISF